MALSVRALAAVKRRSVLRTVQFQTRTGIFDSAVSPNANGVGADVGNPLIARTPLALRGNVTQPDKWSRKS